MVPNQLHFRFLQNIEAQANGIKAKDRSKRTIGYAKNISIRLKVIAKTNIQKHQSKAEKPKAKANVQSEKRNLKEKSIGKEPQTIQTIKIFPTYKSIPLKG